MTGFASGLTPRACAGAAMRTVCGLWLAVVAFYRRGLRPFDEVLPGHVMPSVRSAAHVFAHCARSSSHRSPAVKDLMFDLEFWGHISWRLINGPSPHLRGPGLCPPRTTENPSSLGLRLPPNAQPAPLADPGFSATVLGSTCIAPEEGVC